jgi:pyridoxine 5'-phosphate synthase PdxJ
MDRGWTDNGPDWELAKAFRDQPDRKKDESSPCTEKEVLEKQITTLKKAVEILRASNLYYADKDNWEFAVDEHDDWVASIKRADAIETHTGAYGGFKARQAEAKVKEILGD